MLLAYLLISVGKTSGRSPVYQGMNIVGVTGFIVDCW